jgi:cell division protease FtsH
VLQGSDFDEARDRLILGRREGSNVLLPEEKHAVAVHEAGHALVAAFRPRADPVAKVTILPAGQALGVTEQLPLVERHLYGESYLHDALAVRLGGRAAELVELGEGSTGGANDLASATDLAIKMVREFGLSKELGPVGYPEGGSAFLSGGGPGFSSRPYADETQARIDAAVEALLHKAEQEAVELLRGHQDQLRRLAGRLVEAETIDGSEVYAIAGVLEPARRDVGATLAPARAAAASTGKPDADAPGTKTTPASRSTSDPGAPRP